MVGVVSKDKPGGSLRSKERKLALQHWPIYKDIGFVGLGRARQKDKWLKARLTFFFFFALGMHMLIVCMRVCTEEEEGHCGKRSLHDFITTHSERKCKGGLPIKT